MIRGSRREEALTLFCALNLQISQMCADFQVISVKSVSLCLGVLVVKTVKIFSEIC